MNPVSACPRCGEDVANASTTSVAVDDSDNVGVYHEDCWRQELDERGRIGDRRRGDRRRRISDVATDADQRESLDRRTW